MGAGWYGDSASDSAHEHCAYDSALTSRNNAWFQVTCLTVGVLFLRNAPDIGEMYRLNMFPNKNGGIVTPVLPIPIVCVIPAAISLPSNTTRRFPEALVLLFTSYVETYAFLGRGLVHYELDHHEKACVPST